MRGTAEGVTFDDIASLLEDATMGDRIVRKFATWADFLDDRGYQRGLVLGRIHGRTQGLAEGREEAFAKLRTMLKRQLARRFGTLPDALVISIDQAAEADIEHWMDRVVDAASLDAVFG
jgi:hypothetical protein